VTHGSGHRVSSSGAAVPITAGHSLEPLFATVPIESGARPNHGHGHSTLESSRAAGRAAEKRAVGRVVAAWIANDVAWALILAWTIRRYRRRRS
jgi:hypothetical protein